VKRFKEIVLIAMFSLMVTPVSAQNGQSEYKTYVPVVLGGSVEPGIWCEEGVVLFEHNGQSMDEGWKLIVHETVEILPDPYLGNASAIEVPENCVATIHDLAPIGSGHSLALDSGLYDLTEIEREPLQNEPPGNCGDAGHQYCWSDHVVAVEISGE
jgi:hypothetical protein